MVSDIKRKTGIYWGLDGSKGIKEGDIGFYHDRGRIFLTTFLPKTDII